MYEFQHGIGWNSDSLNRVLQNSELAMERFSSLPPEEQLIVLQQTRNCASDSELQNYIHRLFSISPEQTE